MRQWPQIIEQILNNPTILYISMTSAIVFIYHQQNCMFATIRAIFYLFYCVRVDNRWKKWMG